MLYLQPAQRCCGRNRTSSKRKSPPGYHTLYGPLFHGLTRGTVGRSGNCVNFGKSFADEATGEDAIIRKRDASWKEGIKDRRTISTPTDGGSIGAAIGSNSSPKYGDYIIYENLDGYSFSKGISGAWNHTFLNGMAFSISFNHQIVKYSEIENNVESFFDMEHSPKWSGGLNIKIPVISGWSINSSSNYVGKMQLPKVFDMNDDGSLSSTARSIKSTPFSIHNININGILNNKNEIYFGMLNFFNFRQKEFPLVGYNDPNFDKGFSPFFDTSYAYAPNHGMEFFIGYRFRFGNKLLK